jgi:hypothetical protein
VPPPSNVTPSTSPTSLATPGPDSSNPRLVMVDTPKQITAPGGVAMRVGIDRSTLGRATAPRSVITAIRADRE